MLKIFNVNGKKDYFLLLVSIIITNGLAYIVAKFTSNSVTLYQNINKPYFSPPSWIFGIIWPILYLLMGISLYRILMLKRQGENVNIQITLFMIQFILNLLWSILFFYCGNILAALLDLILLVVFIILTIISFYRKDKIAAILLLPYLLWCIFALILNYFIYKLNK